MKLFIVSGSQRKDSQSVRVSYFLAKQSQDLKLFDNVEVYDLGTDPIPYWGDDFPKGDAWQNTWLPLEKKIQACDALVVVSPEWGGMATPAIKNFLLLTSFNKVAAHKPALLAGVSISRGGSYPVAELRMSGFKNAFINWIPDQLVLRDIGEHMKEPSSPESEYIEERSRYSLKVLKEYASALKQVRNSGVLDYKTYPNGM